MLTKLKHFGWVVWTIIHMKVTGHAKAMTIRPCTLMLVELKLDIGVSTCVLPYTGTIFACIWIYQLSFFLNKVVNNGIEMEVHKSDGSLIRTSIFPKFIKSTRSRGLLESMFNKEKYN